MKFNITIKKRKKFTWLFGRHTGLLYIDWTDNDVDWYPLDFTLIKKKSGNDVAQITSKLRAYANWYQDKHVEGYQAIIIDESFERANSF